MLGLRGNLHGERAALVQQPHQLADARSVVGEPLEAGVREHEVILFRQLFEVMRGVELDKLESRMVFAGVAQHIGRVVRADDMRRREHIREHLRAVADAAADIKDGFRHGFDRADEVIARKRALLFEFAVKLSVPVSHSQFLPSKRRFS